MTKWRTVSVVLIRPDIPRADGKVFTKECLAQMAAEDERFFLDEDGNLCQEVAAELSMPWENN